MQFVSVTVPKIMVLLADVEHDSSQFMFPFKKLICYPILDSVTKGERLIAFGERRGEAMGPRHSLPRRGDSKKARSGEVWRYNGDRKGAAFLIKNI